MICRAISFPIGVVFGCPAFNVLVISADFDHQQEITLFLTLLYHVTCMIPIEIFCLYYRIL
jgi:hypothetical protein